MKLKSKFVCTECGYESLKWIGRCPSCDAWNTFSEEVVDQHKKKMDKLSDNINLYKLDNDNIYEEKRFVTNIEEFDRVLGGGLIPGAVVLIGGDPGIGKSTLVLQAANGLDCKVLYVTGEESINQINLRAKRLNIASQNISLLAETNVDIILSAINKGNFNVIIIDSIQTSFIAELDNAPGTVTQIRESAMKLMEIAKKQLCSIILIGHITKEGYIAGPKILEHMVDAVIQFEGEKNHNYRVLRAYKNRYGSTNEIGLFEMHEIGLRQVTNPSEIFLGERNKNISGSVITCSVEGTRPVLLEVQALLTPSPYGNPQKVATGFDYRRLSILLAVLEKRAGLRVSAMNIFLNIAGGLRIDEPAIDIAVCCSIASSLLDMPVFTDMAVIGEVGLGGELRIISSVEKRIQEAQKLGFTKIIIPKGNAKSVTSKFDIEIIPVSTVGEAIRLALNN